jgi:hypothetical protein
VLIFAWRKEELSLLAYVPGPLAPVPTAAVGFDASGGLLVLTALVAITGASVLLATLTERARRWCADRRGPSGIPASLPV